MTDSAIVFELLIAHSRGVSSAVSLQATECPGWIWWSPKDGAQYIHETAAGLIETMMGFSCH